MTDLDSMNWFQVWVGGVLAGVAVLLALAVTASVGLQDDRRWLGALGMIIVIGLSGWYAYRSMSREIAVGIVAGYGLIALTSAGECTLFVSGDGGGALAAAVIYPAILMVLLIVGGIAAAVSKRRKDGESGE